MKNKKKNTKKGVLAPCIELPWYPRPKSRPLRVYPHSRHLRVSLSLLSLSLSTAQLGFHIRRCGESIQLQKNDDRRANIWRRSGPLRRSLHLRGFLGRCWSRGITPTLSFSLSSTVLIYCWGHLESCRVIYLCFSASNYYCVHNMGRFDDCPLEFQLCCWLDALHMYIWE